MSTAIIFPSSSNTPSFDNVIEQPTAQTQAPSKSKPKPQSSSKSSTSASAAPTSCTNRIHHGNDKPPSYNQANINGNSNTNTASNYNQRSEMDCSNDDNGHDDNGHDDNGHDDNGGDNHNNDDSKEETHSGGTVKPMLDLETNGIQKNDSFIKMDAKLIQNNNHMDTDKKSNENLSTVTTSTIATTISTTACNEMVLYNPDPLHLTSTIQPQQQTQTTAEETAIITTPTTPGALPLPSLSSSSIHPAIEKSKHKGLSNLGNTCYLNSALQMLFGVESFVSMIIDQFYYDDDDDDDDSTTTHTATNTTCHDNDNENYHSVKMKDQFPLHCALANLFKAMSIINEDTNKSTSHNSDNSNNDSDTEETKNQPQQSQSTTTNEQDEIIERKHIENKIRSLKLVIDKLTPQFIGYWQQDSHEFLSMLLDLLHDEFEAQYDKKNDDNDGEEETEKKTEKKEEFEDEKDEAVEMNEEVKSDLENINEENENNASFTTTSTTTPDDETVLENDKISDMAMKEEEKKGYVIVKKSQTISHEDNDLQLNKKPRFTESNTAATANENDQITNHDQVEKSQGDTAIVKPGDDDCGAETTMNDSCTISKVSSFSELKMKDIGVLLYGEEQSQSDDCLPKTRSGSTSSNHDKDCKLVGGRVACDQKGASLDLRMAVDEENNDNRREHHHHQQQQQMQVSDDDNFDAQSQHHQSDTTSSISQTERASSPVDLYFTMEVQTCLTCDSCSFARSRKETFRHLSLEIGDCDDEGEGDSSKKNTSISSTITSLQQQHYERKIQEGLRNFFASEKLELKCEKCFGESATQSMEISRLPKVLILHLKRFIVDVSPDYSSITYRKNRSAVEFGEKLTLDVDDNENGALGEFVSSTVSYPNIPKFELENGITNAYEDFELVNPQNEYENDEEDEYIDLGDMQQSYQLRSVVNHIGRSANCGHYTANVSKLKDSMKAGNVEENREWHNFNDSFVSKIKNEQAICGDVQKSAYLLLYELNK